MDRLETPKEYLNRHLANKSGEFKDIISGAIAHLATKERKYELEGEKSMECVYSKLEDIWDSVDDINQCLTNLKGTIQKPLPNTESQGSDHIDKRLIEDMTGVSVLKKRVGTVLSLIESKDTQNNRIRGCWP